MSSDGFRRGDLVEVRGPAEILATLDERGALSDLPFMPEMAALCGQRFRVDKRAEKICDTINYSGSRRLHDTVLLEDLRCDGSAHEGCQAQCRLFWKEAWLKRVEPSTPPATPPLGSDLRALIERTSSHLKRTTEENGKSEEIWFCQNTELPKASRLLGLTDPRAYLREYTSGNVSLGCFLKITARAMVEEPKRKMGLVPEIHLVGTRTEKVTDPPLDLQPGELVQVKSREEIAATLSPEGRNRGLWFDREMLAYCGGTYRVRHRVTRIIDEYRGGRMVVMKNPCITLEGVICTGERSHRRWFCPRNITLYWREAWLRRVEPPRA
jgi:hypothetical protein